MAGRIPRDFIWWPLSLASDIVQIYWCLGKTEKAGKKSSACCPFHNEKRPSFSVSARKNNSTTVLSGREGNVFSFLMSSHRLGKFPWSNRRTSKNHTVSTSSAEKKAAAPAPTAQQKNQRENDYSTWWKVGHSIFSAFSWNIIRKRPRSSNTVKGRGLSGGHRQAWGYGGLHLQSGIRIKKTFGTDGITNSSRLLEL